MDNDTGKPDVSKIEPVSEGVYQGNGWKYEIIDNNRSTLTLETGIYDFSTTKPTTKDGNVLRLVECTVVVKNGATITGGQFHAMHNYGTVENSLLVSNDIINCDGGTMTNCLFYRSTPPDGVADYHKLTEVNNKFFNATLPNAPYIFSGGTTYYFTGTPTLKVNLPSNKKLHHINGEEHYNDLTGPDSGYYTFTPIAGEDIVLNREPYVTDLVMTPGGFPDTTGREPIYDSAKNVIGCKGKGWKYENGTLTLESGEYDFFTTKPTTNDGKVLALVDCTVVVKNGATITGGRFHAMSNYGTVKNSLLVSDGIINRGGTMTNCLFRRTTLPEGVTDYHKLTEVTNSTFDATLSNAPYTFSDWETYYFTGTPTLTVKVDNNHIIQCINGRADYGDLKPSGVSGYYTFTPNAGEDVVLNLNYYITDLVITKDGFPDTTGREPIYGTGCRGNGWTYDKDNMTLRLENRSYDFSKNGLGQLAPDVKLVVGPSVTLTGGVFNEKPDGLTTDNVQPIILNGSGSIEAVNGLSSPKWNKTLYAIKGSQVEIKASVPLTDINCRAINPRYYLDTNDKTTLRFTTNPSFLETYTIHGETALILNKSSRTNLIMKEDGSPDLEGIPYDRSFNEYIYTGDGWRYVDGISDYLELTAHSYNFRYCDPLNNKISNELAAVTCDITNSSGATIEDGIFKNFVENYGGTINGGTFAAGLLVRYATEQGTVTGGAFNGNTALSDKAHPVTVHDGHIRKVNDTEPRVLDSSFHLTTGTEWNLYSYEGTIVTVTADTDITNINGWDIGKFTASSYPNGNKRTVRFRMPDGPVVLNDTLYTLDITRGKTLGNTSVAVPAGTELPLVADKPAENETFLGWTLSDESLLKDGTLNDPECTTITIKMKDASATAEAVFQKDTPAYTLTVTGGGLVNGKTSAVVEAGEEVRLTVGEGQDGMSFNYWDLPTALTKALIAEDSNFSNKVEPLTFTMPDLSGYTEDTHFTIRLDIRPAELPDDDDGPSVLGTMATVAVGGAAAGILVWQGVSLGVDSYLQLSLPGGVPVPTNRRELVKLLWETAGKPDVVLPALYGDVSAEDAELQKATRWAIDNGLVKPADETDASRFDPDRSVSKYEVARAWFKLKKLMK